MRCAAFILCLFCLLTPSLPASSNQLVLVVTEENDLFYNPCGEHQDRHYTQGLRIAVMAGPGAFRRATAQLNSLLPAPGLACQEAQFGWAIIGQNIYTPTDITRVRRVPNDRPYAGWLYTGLIFQRHGTGFHQLPTLENWELDLGVVGPESLADQAQSKVHQYQDPNYLPVGWEDQLSTEFGLELKYARHWRWEPLPRLQGRVDLIPHLGASLGNIHTHLSAGSLLRLGYNLPADFGPHLIDSAGTDYSGLARPARPCGLYLFGGIAGRVVARNIFLDGNTFQSSERTDKEHLVGDLIWGAACHLLGHFEASYTWVRRSEEYHTQPGPSRFASLNVRLRFSF
jgi:hypothetical protein